jgi:glucan 1,3-beta-glucosidase
MAVGDSVSQTLSVQQNITIKYAKPDYQDFVVVGIELLNESSSSELKYNQLKQLYRDRYDQICTVSDSPVMIHDAINPRSSWNGFLSASENNSQVGA